MLQPQSQIQQQSQVQAQEKKQFAVSLARTESEVRKAQRLRYKVFAEEMGGADAGQGRAPRPGHV